MVSDRTVDPSSPGIPFVGSGGLDREVVFDVLRNERRRYAFHYLRRRDGPVPLRELSDQVAAWEYDTDVDDLDQAQRQRVYVSLCQNHLPKMDEADVVDFDSGDNTVELAENASDVRVYLEVVPDDDILWAQYYLGVAGMGVAFLVAVWIDLPPFPSYVLPVGGALVLVFALSALLHYRQLRRQGPGYGGKPV
jgi:hypothetical protein